MKNQASLIKTIFAFRQLTHVAVFSIGICALFPLLEESSEARDSSNYTNSNQSNNAARKRSSAQTKKNTRPARKAQYRSVWLSFKVVGGIEPTNEVFPADTGTKIFDDGVCPPHNPIFDCEGRKMIQRNR